MLVCIITNAFFNDTGTPGPLGVPRRTGRDIIYRRKTGTNGITIEVFVQFTEPLALGSRHIRGGRRKIQDDVFFYPEPKSPQCVFVDLLAQYAYLSVTEIPGLQGVMRYLISTVLNGILSWNMRPNSLIRSCQRLRETCGLHPQGFV